MSLKVSYIEPTQYVLKSRSKNNTSQFLIDIFVENGHKKTFLENYLKTIMTKRKTMIVAITPTQRKSPGYLT